MLDRELIEGIKNGEDHLIYVLHTRYRAMIEKHALAIARKLGHYGRIDEEIREDFRQDAFLEMIEAVNYCDFSRIENLNDDWKFVGVFWYYLMNLRKRYIRKHRREACYNIEDYRNTITSRSYSLTEDKTNEMYQKFFEAITPKQKEILQYYQSGMTIQQIRVKIGKSYGYVRWEIAKAKEIAKEIFSRELSCTVK